MNSNLIFCTITKDDPQGLIRTEESLFGKNHSQIEKSDWYIWDGSSEIHELIADFPKKYHYFHGEDEGISDAFNKLVTSVKRKDCHIIFLNSGDLLLHDARFLNALCESHKDRLIIGRVKFNGKIIGKKISFQRQCWRNYLPHQGMMIPISFFENFGLYRCDFKLGMDYEWSLRLQKIWGEILFIRDIISYMEPGGASVTNYKDTYASYVRARKVHNLNSMTAGLISKLLVLKMWFGIKFRWLAAKLKL